MKIIKYVPFISSSILTFILFQVLININFPEKIYFEKKYIIESRIDDAYRYLDKTKKLNLNLYNSNLEKFLINTLKYCYFNNRKICAVADTIENEYLTISFKKFEKFDSKDDNEQNEILKKISKDNLNYLISQIEFLKVLEQSSKISGSIDIEEFLLNLNSLPVMEIINTKLEIKQPPILLLSILSFFISCIFGFGISSGIRSFLNKNS